MRKDQKGFSVIEVLLVIFCVCIVVFAGWYVWSSRKPTKSNAGTMPKSSTSTKQARAGFSSDEIDGLETIPADGQPVVIETSKKFYENCTPVNIKPRFSVTIVQSNFVEVAMGCDGGGMYEFGMDGGKWAFLSSGATGLDCAYVAKYGITQSSLKGGRLTTCVDFANNGQEEPIPAKS